MVKADSIQLNINSHIPIAPKFSMNKTQTRNFFHHKHFKHEQIYHEIYNIHMNLLYT